MQPARVGVLGAGEGSGKGLFVSASHTWQESEVVWPRAKVGRGGAAARPQQQGWGPGGGSAGHTWQEPEAGVLGAHQRPQLGTQDLLVVLLVLDLEHVVPLAGIGPAGELRPGRHRGLVGRRWEAMPEVCMMPWMLGTTPRPLAWPCSSPWTSS